MALYNRLKLLNNFLRQKPLVNHGPVEVEIEATNRCNLACPMCNRSQMDRPLGDMSWETFKKIVEQTKNTAEIYYFCGLGEQLMHPLLPKMINYCNNVGAATGLPTNAHFLGQSETEALLQNQPSFLVISLDAMTKETYAKIRVGGDFKRVVENTKYYLKRYLKEKPKTQLVMQFVDQEENHTELVEFIKYWKGQGAPLVRIKPRTPLNNKPNQKGTGCLNLWRSLYVTWNGEVFPCPCAMGTNRESFRLGNIHQKSLGQIWNGESWQSLRASFKQKNKHPLCAVCWFRQPKKAVAILMSFLPTKQIIRTTPYFERLEQLTSLRFWQW